MMAVASPPVPISSVPEPVTWPEATAQIRRARQEIGLRTLVLDDDPTGSQAVHGLEVVLVSEPKACCDALRSGPAFVLTNSRSLDEADAVHLTKALVQGVDEHLGNPPGLRFVSRSDSTLRGHLVAEIEVLRAERVRAGHEPYDGILLAPAFFEAGRVTAEDLHWAKVGGSFIGVGDTEFARDATFGYSTSHLPTLIEERSGGTVQREDVLSISLRDIRDGGPDRVAEICRRARGGTWIVVNGLAYDDYDIVALGALRAEADGTALAVRCGPSFVRSYLGIEPTSCVDPSVLSWRDRTPRRHGVVVVGSHTSVTTAQLTGLVDQVGAQVLELDVEALLDDRRREDVVSTVAEQVSVELESTVVVVATSRTLVAGHDAQSSLAIARGVSAALAEILARVIPFGPAWVVAKGGITSHDMAVHGLGMRRAEVVGQIFPGQVSIFRPIEATTECRSIPYVVFPGNVGDASSLAHVVARLEAGEAR